MIINREEVSPNEYRLASEVLDGELVLIEDEYCIVTNSYDSDMYRQAVCLGSGMLISLHPTKNVKPVVQYDFTVYEEV